MRKKTELSTEEQQQLLKEMFGQDAFSRTAKSEEVVVAEQPTSLPVEKAIVEEPSIEAQPTKRISSKQRKASLDEYQEAFMRTPKIEDRKPVFISREKRDRLNRIVGLFGDDRMSVSGMVENIVSHHLQTYGEDIEAWRKL